MTGNGYNPIRHDCERNGCFNVKCRPKIELFCDCFPDRVSLGDVDGFVELNRKFLFIEWVRCGGEAAGGQWYAHVRLSRLDPVTVMYVMGNQETMEIDGYAILDGACSESSRCEWQTSDISGVKDVLADWARAADPRRAHRVTHTGSAGLFVSDELADKTAGELLPF